MGEPSSVSVVVPVYRNEASLDELVQRLVETLTTMGRRFELLLIDDGSPDLSWERIKTLSAAHPEVVGLRLSRNFGQHPAIAAGLERAQGDITVLMDADLQDEPEQLPLLLSKLEEGNDVVYTVNVDRASGGARLSSALFHSSFSRVANVAVPHSIGTYRVFNRKFREAVLSYPERRALYGPLMLYMGFEAAFIPVRRQASATGSGYTFAKRLGLAAETMVSYTNVPHRALLICGSTLSAASAIYLVALVVDYLIRGPALASGVTLLLGITLLFMGTVLLSIGIVGSYVFRVFQEVLGRPRYLLADVMDTKPLAVAPKGPRKVAAESTPGRTDGDVPEGASVRSEPD
jgi:glycosyltransferase involved in cell wall biosynthesis